MGNYVGYFRSLEKDHLYSVKLIGNSADTNFTEIKLAGQMPFVVTYQESNTPFDPVRKSNAVIRIIHTNYLEDILSPNAQSTRVILTDETANSVEWVGFLTPKIFSADYVTCPYEDFELEAADCVSSLQYIDFETQTSGMCQMVSLQNLLGQICDKCQLLNSYYWTRSKQYNANIILPGRLKISEENFFSSDTKEPWKLSEVLEEICKYLGFTAVQWKENLYLIDYQYFHNHDRLVFTRYSKSNGYAQGASSSGDTTFTISQAAVRGANHTISYEPVYNKIVVKDNFYNIDEIIPNIFDDKYLTNRHDRYLNSGETDFYYSYEVSPEVEQWEDTSQAFPDPSRSYDIDIWTAKDRRDHYYCARYPYGSVALGIDQGYKWEKYAEKSDATKWNGGLVLDNYYRYFKRNYDHDYWKSCYYNMSSSQELNLDNDTLSGNSCMRDYVGATICDFASVRKNHISDYGQYIVPSKMDYDRALCMSLKYRHDGKAVLEAPLMKLSGYTFSSVLPESSFIVLNFTGMYERYERRAYINPDWSTEPCKRCAITAYDTYSGGGNPRFKLRIGNKWWNGREWDTEEKPFTVVMERTSEQMDVWNTEEKVLNNVSWDMYVNESGYKIPLSGLSFDSGIDFQILRPSKQWYMEYPQNNVYIYGWNAYYWIKDFSIKVITTNQDKEREDSDVIYENIMNEDAVSTLSDITLRVTTSHPDIAPSWSNMILYTGNTNILLDKLYEESIPGQSHTSGQTPEQNIVQKYYYEYSTPTAKFNWDLQLDEITPLTKIYRAKVDAAMEGYCQLGTEIDYKNYKQSVKLVHLK